ncbi:putative F-box protein [Forsythia ovata]|uniref:F-box protein n=1 Tax=Forsythia ovata TaxID=205694 RepID=A0ABD1S237_9LAMI
MSPKQKLQNSYLPEDVIVEILARVPVKNLLRFKCVCTRWRKLILSPWFVSLHLNRSIFNPTRHSILVPSRCGNQSVSLDPVTFSPIQNFNQAHSFAQRVMYVGSINGLLCIRGDSPDCISIWNPSTRLFKKLPLGRHYSPINISFGFGWDPIANDYKVIKIGYQSNLENGQIKTWAEVWSANSDSWREIKVERNFFLCRNVYDVFVKGFAHWLVKDGLKSNIKPLVASFDMNTEVLQLVPVPEHLIGKPSALFCMNWKETFALAGCVSREPTKIYQVWTMESGSVGKEPWSKKFTFELDVDFYCFLYNVNGKLLLNRHGDVILYDVETRETKTIVTQWMVRVQYHVESLVSIKGFNPLGKDAKKME